LVGRFVRKCDPEDLFSTNVAIFDQMRDTIRDDTCLAAARPCQNQDWAVSRFDGFELLRVEKFG
jgi:hypothetical protein